MDPTQAFLAMIAAHYFFDFAGQGDFMSKAKNHTAPISGVSPFGVLLGHSYLHGFAVGAITGSFALGLAEALSHGATDRAKCGGAISFEEDQTIHIVLKAVWAVLLLGLTS
jgi:hypothetical protein